MGERVGPQGRYRALNSAHAYSERDVVGCYGWAWRGLAWAPDLKAAGSIPARRTSTRERACRDTDREPFALGGSPAGLSSAPWRRSVPRAREPGGSSLSWVGFRRSVY